MELEKIKPSHPTIFATQPFDEPKQRRHLTITETGWKGAQAMAVAVGCRGVSELLEKLGRGELVVSSPEQSA